MKALMLIKLQFSLIFSFGFIILWISLTFLFPFVLEMGAVPISSNVPIPSVDDLADQVAAVLNYFG